MTTQNLADDTRRHFLSGAGLGLGALALSSLIGEESRGDVPIDAMQPLAERRHLSRRAGRDAAEDEVVVALRAHQLRTTSRLAPSALMAPAAAIADEQRLAACDLRRQIGGRCLGGANWRRSTEAAAHDSRQQNRAAGTGSFLGHACFRLLIAEKPQLAQIGSPDLRQLRRSSDGPMRAPHSFQSVDDQRAGILLHHRVGRAEHRRIAFADHARESGDNGNVLLAVGLVADDAAVMEDAVVGLP